MNWNKVVLLCAAVAVASFAGVASAEPGKFTVQNGSDATLFVFDTSAPNVPVTISISNDGPADLTIVYYFATTSASIPFRAKQTMKFLVAPQNSPAPRQNFIKVVAPDSGGASGTFDINEWR